MALIYSFDGTFRDWFSDRVLVELRLRLWCRPEMDERFYCVRNYVEEEWGMIPRYISPEDGRAYGTYLLLHKNARRPL